MISDIRKAFKGPLYRTVLIALALSFVAGMILPLLMRRGSTVPWVMRINGSPISYREYVKEVRSQEQYRTQLRAQFGNRADELLRFMRIPVDAQAAAREQFMGTAIVEQAFNAIGFRLNQDYIAEKLHDRDFVQRHLSDLMPSFIFDAQGAIQQEALSDFLRRIGMTSAEFHQKIEQIMRKNILDSLVDTLVYVSQADIASHLKAKTAQRFYTIFRLQPDTFLVEERKKDISPEELKQFYMQESSKGAAYWVPERRAGRIWRFTPKHYEISVDAREIETYYHEHKQSEFQDQPAQVIVRRILLKVPDIQQEDTVLARANDLYARLINNKEEFTKLAKQFSDDKETASKGGLLAPLSRSDTTYDRSLIKAAFLLKQDNDISSVIRTQEGYAIIQRVNRQDPSFKPLAKVREQITQKLTAKKFRDAFGADAFRLMQKQRNDGDEAGRVVEELAQRYNVKAHTIPLGDRKQQEQGPLADTLFKLHEGEFGFYSNNDEGVIIQVTDIKPRERSSFESVKNTVLDDLTAQRARNRMEQVARDARQDLQGATKALRSEFKPFFSVEKLGPVRAEDLPSLAKDLPLKHMMSLEREGSIMSARSEQGPLLIRLEKLVETENSEGKALEKDIRQEIRNRYTHLLREGFVATLRRNAIVETNESSQDSSSEPIAIPE